MLAAAKSAESLPSSLSALAAVLLAPKNALESRPSSLSALKLVAVPASGLTVRGGSPGCTTRFRAAPVPLLIRVVTAVAVFVTPFKIEAAVSPPEGGGSPPAGGFAKARETTPPTRATITARPTTIDVALVRRHSLISVAFIASIRACANRRVAYVARSSKKAIEALLPLSSTKSCQPIGAASKGNSIFTPRPVGQRGSLPRR